MKLRPVSLENEHLLIREGVDDEMVHHLSNRFHQRFPKQYQLLVEKLEQRALTDQAVTDSGIFRSNIDSTLLGRVIRLLSHEIKRLSSFPEVECYDRYNRALVFHKSRLSFRCKVRKLQALLFENDEFRSRLEIHGYRLKSFTIHLSNSNDSVHYQFGRWRDPLFRAEALNKYQQFQLHYDPDATNLKGIVYLSDVSENIHGPFHFIPYSNEITMENIVARAAGATMCGVSLLEDPSGVKFFRSLPEHLRHHNIVGSVFCGSETEELIARSSLSLPEAMYGAAGTFCIFDPVGLHRGGFCRDRGSRLNLQLLFERA